MLNYRITKDNQIKNSVKRDFSSGSVVESLPAMQGSWVCFLTREIPHAVEQLSPCSTTREAEAESSPCSLQLGKSLPSSGDPAQPEINKLFLKIVKNIGQGPQICAPFPHPQYKINLSVPV